MKIAADKTLNLSPGPHSELIGEIVEQFAPRFLPGAQLIYVGDTRNKTGYFDEPALAALGVVVDSHGKFPDVVFHYQQKNWLVLIESVTSHGPVDGKRHAELATLFSAFENGLVFVTAFPSRRIMARYLDELVKMTGWQANSVRTFISTSAKSLGCAISSTKGRDGKRRYRIER